MPVAMLPYLDEHTVAVDAGAGAVWSALLETLDRSLDRPAWAAYARLVGCADRDASGPRPLEAGSTVPGFHVVSAVPGAELVLRGRHRFSTYELAFRIEAVEPARSRLRAESRAAFPGIHGRAYRALVLGTRGHAVAVRRLLAAVEHRAGTA